MRLMGITMKTMMKTALEETVAQAMNSKALLKKAKKLDKSSGQSCSNGRLSSTELATSAAV